MKKIKRALCLAMATPAIITATVSVSPEAAAQSSSCRGLVCLYDHNGYRGFLGSRNAGIGLMNISRQSNDRMSSWINNTRSNAAWYSKANGEGTCHTMRAMSRNDYVGWRWNDTASSWRTNRGCN